MKDGENNLAHCKHWVKKYKTGVSKEWREMDRIDAETPLNNADTDLQSPSGRQQTKSVPFTFWFVFSLFVCGFGSSFPYGYNIGIVNTLAEIIKLFYAKAHLARDGIDTAYKIMEGSHTLLYIPTTTADNMTAVYAELGNTFVERNTTADFQATAVHPYQVPIDENFLWSVTVAIYVLGGMVGAALSGKVADQFGRKRGMVISTAIMVLSALFGGIPIIANSPECLVISRLLAGVHCGINTSLASLYLTEISHKINRRAIAEFHQLSITVGILWSAVMSLPEITGTWSLWPICFAFNAVPALLSLVLLPLCPESPRFLMIKKKDEDGARKALQTLRGYQDVNDEIDEMRIEAARAVSVQKFTLKQLLTIPELRLPVIIAVVCQVAQQCSGINVAMSYSSFIYKQASVIAVTIPRVIVTQGFINFLVTIIAVPFIKKLGRRTLLLIPMCFMVLSLIGLCVCLNLQKNPEFEEWKNILSYLCIGSMMVYVIGFAFGLGPIPYTVLSEIFKQGPRATATSFSLAFNWISHFLVVFSFTFIQTGMEEYTYVVYASILLATIAFLKIFIPKK